MVPGQYALHFLLVQMASVRRYNAQHSVAFGGYRALRWYLRRQGLSNKSGIEPQPRDSENLDAAKFSRSQVPEPVDSEAVVLPTLCNALLRQLLFHRNLHQGWQIDERFYPKILLP